MECRNRTGRSAECPERQLRGVRGAGPVASLRPSFEVIGILWVYGDASTDGPKFDSQHKFSFRGPLLIRCIL